VENTIYLAGVSGLAPKNSSYQSWGHSMLVDPFGDILVNLGRSEGFSLAELDPQRLKDIRERLPLLNQRRQDLYEINSK
jgi:predicted amidohydrolase